MVCICNNWIYLSENMAPPCSSNSYQCINYQCISRDRLCDLRPDCLLGEDEDDRWIVVRKIVQIRGGGVFFYQLETSSNNMNINGDVIKFLSYSEANVCSSLSLMMNNFFPPSIPQKIKVYVSHCFRVTVLWCHLSLK